MSFEKVIIGNATLYRGDCMEVLPTLPKVDAVITDPPYGISYIGSTTGGKGSISTTGKVHHVAIHGDDQPFDPAPFLAIARCCFTGAHHFAERLTGGSFHVWNKRGPYAPIDQADGDLIWIGGEKRALRIVDMVWRGLCRQVEHDQKIEHPTQKPVALMSWCIDQMGKPSLILDPYMGSGTTGVAAVQAGLSFIGIEFKREYFDIACRRIEQAQQQASLFEPAPPQPKQAGLEL